MEREITQIKRLTTIDDLPTRTIHTCFDGIVKYYKVEEHFVHFCTQQFFFF